jgi:RNA polymerase sigma factor (sigma-70 family)
MATAQLGTLLRHIQQSTAGQCARQWTDRQLLDDFAFRHSEAAFTALVSRHGPMVLRVCRRVLNHEQDAEDAFQAAFLVLARNTGSIRKREAVASWLHGVAYRTAMKAKRSAARRRNHEAWLRAVEAPAAAGPTWDDVQAVLDEEVQQLSPCFREAFVLCVLQGKSGAEAAAELGCKEGTVKSRVNRARQSLQRQLAGRGIKLTALLAALSVAESVGRAALPATLARTTVRLGPLVAAGKPAAGAIPSHVAALAAGVTRAMFTRKLKVATAVLLAVGLVATGAGLLARQALAAGERAVEGPQPAPATAKPQAAEGKGTIAFGGRVLGPDGRPVAGARLYLTLAWSYMKRPGASPVHATTEEDGRFRFTVPKAKYGRYVAAVVAVAPGYGPGWVEVLPDAAKDKLELRLVKDDMPLDGHIVDLQGRPVRGATVRMLHLLGAPKEDLGPWAKAVREKREGSHRLERQYLPRQLMSQEIPGLPKKATTDADGRFRLTGIGRERMAVLQIEGPTIATRQVRALTRPGATIEAPEWKSVGEPGRTQPVMSYYGATFTHAAAPTKPIVGVVRDRDTNRPLAGFTVRSYKLANNPMHGIDFIETKTDAAGRYRLTGMPKGKDNKILVVPPDGQPYVTVHAVVPDTDALQPVTVDVALKRGVWVEGKITDKATGQPLQGTVNYYALYDNPNLRDYPGFTGTFFSRPTFNVQEDGTYRVVGLPGPGLLAVQYSDHYLLARERDDPDGTKEPFLNTAPFAVSGISYNALARINPTRGAEPNKRDVALDPGRTFQGRVLGPDGKPLAGARGFGLSGWGGWDRDGMKAPEFTVLAFNPRRPRDLLFQHLDKGLVGVAKPPKDKEGSVTVRMRPGATVTGRLVDADGQPRAGVELGLTFHPKERAASYQYFPERIQTDHEGRFRVAALLPGYEFTLSDGKGHLHFGGALRSGETKPLGDVRMKQSGE